MNRSKKHKVCVSLAAFLYPVLGGAQGPQVDAFFCTKLKHRGSRTTLRHWLEPRRPASPGLNLFQTRQLGKDKGRTSQRGGHGGTHRASSLESGCHGLRTTRFVGRHPCVWNVECGPPAGEPSRILGVVQQHVSPSGGLFQSGRTSQPACLPARAKAIVEEGLEQVISNAIWGAATQRQPDKVTRS